MWIWVHSNLKKRNKNIVKHVLEWCHNSHFFVNIVQPRKLQDIIRTTINCLVYNRPANEAINGKQEKVPQILLDIWQSQGNDQYISNIVQLLIIWR